MKLNALHGELLVAHTHDFTVVCPGRHFEALRQCVALDDQRMVARRGERVRQIAEHAGIPMIYARYLAMHDLFRVHDISAKGLADALMAETNSQHRNFTSEITDHRY